MPALSVLKRKRQEDEEFNVNLGYIVVFKKMLCVGGSEDNLVNLILYFPQANSRNLVKPRSSGLVVKALTH